MDKQVKTGFTVLGISVLALFGLSVYAFGFRDALVIFSFVSAYLGVVAGIYLIALRWRK